MSVASADTKGEIRPNPETVDSFELARCACGPILTNIIETVISNFWNSFGDDWQANCLKWAHHVDPFMPNDGSGWKSVYTANPNILEFNGKKLLYYRASGQTSSAPDVRDRIGVAELDGHHFTDSPSNPVIEIGPPGGFDGTDILDPATVVWKGKVWLYYSAVGETSSIGLATSDDGITFTKHGSVVDGRCPEVFAEGDEIFMLYQVFQPSGRSLVHVAKSGDGIHFEAVQEAAILGGTEGEWDSFSVATVRHVGREGGFHYVMYGGSSYLSDEPEYFGLARSSDLVNWEKHAGNPIFGCGARGAIDGGAMWFPALVLQENEWLLLYEGSPGKAAWASDSKICSATLAR